MANQNFKVKKGLEVGTGVTISDGNINISGIITAQFKGDGSALTGVTAAGSGVVVQEEGSNVGTAATINFIGSNVTAALSGGIANVTVSGGSGGLSNVVEDTTPQLGGNLDLNSKDITGTGNISITGGFNATGVSTFQENVNFTSTASFGDNDKINVGTGNDLQIFHDGTSNIISDAVGAGISLVGNTKVVGVLTATSFSGSLATTNLTGTITNAQLSNDSVSFGGVSVDLGSSDATPAFDLSDATNYPTSSLSGTITNAQLAGSIADGKLASTFLKNVVEDTTPQLGGNLDVNGKDTTGTGNINLTGIVTATSFSGSGSALTGLTGASAGTYGASTNTPIITVDSNGRVTGIATVATSGAGGGGGISNIVEDTTPQLGGNLDLNSKSITGTGNIEITGYAGVSGVSTFSGAVGFATHIHDAGTGNLDIRSNLLRIKNDAGSETLATFAEDGAVSFYHNNALRLATTNTGVTVTGTLAATAVTGNGSALTNVNAATLDSIDSSQFLRSDIATTKSSGDMVINDGIEFKFGNASDLVIGHNGSSSNITQQGTGPLLISQFVDDEDIRIRSDNGSGSIANYFVADGSTGEAILYHYGTEKLATKSGGVTVTGTLAATAVTGDGSGLTNLPASGISTASSNVQVNFDVTANGSGAYRFTGPGNDAADDNPDLYLIRGQRYRFTNNSGGSHPFQIRSAAGGSAYSTGVTNNGGASGNIDFNVQHDAPSRLYYQCTSHSAMVGNIYITGGANWQTTSVNTSTAEEIFTLNNVGIGTNNPVGNLEVRDTKANLIVAKDGLTVKSNSNLHTTYDMLQIGAGGALASYSTATATADTQLVHNAYRHSGGTHKYRYADTATRLRMNTPGGSFRFENAASGSADADITFTERLRITSGGQVNIGGDYSQTDSKVTIVDASRPIAEATLNLQSSTTSGAADTGPVLRFYGHSGSEGRYHASIKGAKENGTSGNTAGYLALNTRPAGGAMAERLRITSAGHTLFSGLTSNVDTRNAAGISLSSPGGITFRRTSSTGSRNWRLRPDDLSAWGSLEFSVAPTDGSSDIPDAAGDVVLELKSNKDVKIHDGNLVIGTSGHGIDFSASGNTGGMQSELLDDYEEGVWTPTLIGSSSNPSVSFSTQGGAYEKIGALVHASFFMAVSGVSSQGSGQLRIGGLPFNASSNINASEVPAVLLQSEPFTDGDGSNRAQFARTAAGNFLICGYRDLTTGNCPVPGNAAANVGTGYFIGHITYRTLS